MLSNFKKSSSIAVLLLISCAIMAQDHLTGVVMEENDKGVLTPLYGVNVYWQGTTIGTSTDTNGVFSIADDHANHQLIFSYVGYQNDTIQIVNHKDLMVVLKNARVIDEVEIVYRTKSTSLSRMDARHVENLSEKELFKAACCNLSESFETNASVDAAYADAISGTKQIQMLGLAGIYTQILTENLPTNRGLASVYGLAYTPGPWLEGISISKGAGSVVNGYESITGQINTELFKPENENQFLFNAYGNQSGRIEANAYQKLRLNERWSTSLFLHGRNSLFENDMNQDGFMDMPLNESFVGLNRWKYQGVRGVESQFGVKFIEMSNRGGQLAHDFNKPINEQLTWGTDMKTSRQEAFGKIGYVFPQHKYNSIGFQLAGSRHAMENYFGQRVYNGLENSLYANLIFQTIINNTNHKLKLGASYLYDDYDEHLDSISYLRTELVPGAFMEYTYTYDTRLTAVIGMRADYHNIYGMIYSPRIHLRYGFTETTIARISAGMGTRVANVLAENSGYLASSRAFVIPGQTKAFGLDPERAINAGISLSQDFKLDYREGSIVIDFFRTEFLDQVVADVDANAQQVRFYNLAGGTSYANSFQVELNYELIKRLDVKMAYRLYDVQTTYITGQLQKALLARNKAFLNIAYETKLNKKFGQWKSDVTLQYIGTQRLPNTQTNPAIYQRPQEAPAYLLINAQITRVFNKNFDIYLGGENLTNYRQPDPIVSVDNPYGPYFDGSMVYAPIFGVNVYAGLRYRIK